MVAPMMTPIRNCHQLYRLARAIPYSLSVRSLLLDTIETSSRVDIFKQKWNRQHLISKSFIHSTRSLRMFIQVEDTPNPNSLKFYPGQIVLETGTADFQDKVQASMRSPLAKALFRIKGVKSVFFAQDFITVTKDDDDKIDWGVLKPQIFSEIMIFYTMGQPILYGDLKDDPNMVNDDDSDIVREIKELISEKIRPTIQEDGGDLEFVSYDDKIVKVRLQGACTSCPSSVITLKNGIKNMLQFYIPEIEDVEQISDEST